MLKSLRALVSELGAPLAVLYAIHIALGRISGGRARLVPYAFTAQPIGHAEGVAVRADPGTVIRLASNDDPMVAAFPRPPDVLAIRYRRGAQCYAAIVKGRFAGHIWIRRDHYDEDEVRCRYVLAAPHNSVWDFDVYVVPEYRLGRTLARLWQAVDAALAEQGVQWTFSRISLFNPASLKAHARLGAVRVSSAVFVVLGRLQLGFFSRAPFVNVSVDRAPTIFFTPPRGVMTASSSVA